MIRCPARVGGPVKRLVAPVFVALLVLGCGGVGDVVEDATVARYVTGWFESDDGSLVVLHCKILSSWGG